MNTKKESEQPHGQPTRKSMKSVVCLYLDKHHLLKSYSISEAIADTELYIGITLEWKTTSLSIKAIIKEGCT